MPQIISQALLLLFTLIFPAHARRLELTAGHERRLPAHVEDFGVDGHSSMSTPAAPLRSRVVVGEASRYGGGHGRKACRRRGAMKGLASCQKRGCPGIQAPRQSRLPRAVICWLCLLDRVSRLAAASTIPVTNAAMQ